MGGGCRGRLFGCVLADEEVKTQTRAKIAPLREDDLMAGRIDDPKYTYTHEETFVRSELPDITIACAKAKLSFAFIPVDGEKNAWTVRVPANQERELLKALKAAGV